MQLSEDLCLYIEYGYIIEGYLSPCRDSLSRGTHQPLRLFSSRSVTRPFLIVLRPRRAGEG